jgi:uncharacterized protein (DUF983 family)
MTDHPSPSVQPRAPKTFGRAFQYFLRATLLRCPECGVSPIFPSITKARRLGDIFTTLEGCPICRYKYEREIGYFLMATWAVSYGVGSLLALALYLYMDYVLHASISTMLWTILPIILAINVVLARHARAYWIAIDHFFDPQAPPKPSKP